MHSARRLLLLAAAMLLAVPRLHAQDPADSPPRARYRHIAISEALDSAGLAARLRELPELPTRDLLGDGARTVMVRFVVGRDGRTGAASVDESSGVEAVDAKALDVAGIMRFDTAKIEGEPVPVLIQLPITFFR